MDKKILTDVYQQSIYNEAIAVNSQDEKDYFNTIFNDVLYDLETDKELNEMLNQLTNKAKIKYEDYLKQYQSKFKITNEQLQEIKDAISDLIDNDDKDVNNFVKIMLQE